MTNKERLESTPKLSVITVFWNGRDDVDEYLEAMDRTQREVPFEVESIIVDNGSVDGTGEYIRERYPWVKLVANERNVGFAVGCNDGLNAATGDYLLLLNPDARPNAKAFKGMVTFLERHRRVGATGCMLLHDDGLPQQSAFADLSPSSYWTNHSFLYPTREKIRKLIWRLGLAGSKKPRKVGWMQGSCLMVSRRVYDKIGGLEPSYFMYCEDTDWCRKVREAGYQVVHLPGLALRHRQMGSTKHKPEYCFRRVYRSVVLYTNRWMSGRERRRMLGVLAWDMRLRLPIYRVLWLIRPAERERYAARMASVRQLIDVIRAGDPDLYDDPPPR